jgi:hypothetical protein
LFNIIIEDVVAFANVDIILLSGGINQLATIKYMVNVRDGLLSISFQGVLHDGIISAIEVHSIRKSTSAPALVATRSPSRAPVVWSAPKNIKALLYINCGGGDYYDEKTGIQWKADSHFINGAPLRIPGYLQIENPLYHTVRYQNHRYEIPAPDGEYQLILHFVEGWTNARYGRLFNIVIEDVVAFKNVDVILLSGGINRFATIKYDATVRDGLLSIYFEGVLYDPIISAIEVHSITTAAPTLIATRSPSRAPVVQTGNEPKQCIVPKVSLNTWRNDRVT